MEVCALNNLLSYYTEEDAGRKVRGQYEDNIKIKFCKSLEGKKDHLQIFFRIGVLKNFTIFNKFINLKRDSKGGVFL